MFLLNMLSKSLRVFSITSLQYKMFLLNFENTGTAIKITNFTIQNVPIKYIRI